jgi:predicted CoA-binding protein
MPQSSVAVIGASSDRRKFGNKAVRAYLENDYTVFPVNPREESIEGLKVYHTVEEIPGPVQIVSIYVPPAVGIKMLEAIADIHPQEVWLNPGSESDDLIEAAADLKLRVVVACSISALGMDPDNISDD